ncbi:hypothetical protein V494_03585 [Pseudogymnoascus sp. VKM F-4513 (FW-928)]|nr:hypothetical protein V494_03585 [Pseudogymnoascus sp. VKM F-4513 (FW-928)]
MGQYSENENSTAVANSPKIAEISAISNRPPLPGSDNGTIVRGGKQQDSPQTDTPTTDKDSPLYISAKKARRRQRQSLSAISNRSIVTDYEAEISSRVASRLNREKLAWETINAEILEWQTVCRTGRPSWWSPASRWTRQRRARSRTGGDWASLAEAEYGDFGDSWPTPAQRFEQQKLSKGISNPQEQAFITAVQLLSVSFTLPVEQFENYKNSTNLYFANLASDGVPDARLISSLRMHTDYRWSPAFGHEPRSSSPEYLRKGTHGREQPLAGLGDAPVSLDLSHSGRSRRSKRKRKRHRMRYVTPADTSRQEHADKVDSQGGNPGLRSPVSSPVEESLSDSTRKTKTHMMPGRRAHSCPVSPTLTTKPVGSRPTRLQHHLPTHEEKDELPKEVPKARWQLESSRYTLEPAIRSEPHPVFIQPVKELVVKSWQTFRKKLDNTLGRGCLDPGGTSAPFRNEQMASSWPALVGPSASSWAVQRRRNVRERHDIYSSSVDSSPRYNSLTSGTTSDASSQIRTDPAATLPSARGSSFLSEVVNSARANKNPSSGHSFPSLISNSTSDADSESSSPRPIPRNPAGFFIGKTTENGPNHTIPSFVPLRGSNRRARRRSMLSEVSTPYGDIILTEAEQSLIEGGGDDVTVDLDKLKPDYSPKFLHEMMCEAGPEPHKLARCRSLDHLAGRTDSSENMYGRAERHEVDRSKSRLQRISSAGTTVITPSDDSVDIGGSPTGPPTNTWDEVDRKGKRRTRSFL